YHWTLAAKDGWASSGTGTALQGRDQRVEVGRDELRASDRPRPPRTRPHPDGSRGAQRTQGN
ncbi:hypothetical protein ABZ372_25325, partial [Streptomyces sp. NPDC005921]